LKKTRAKHITEIVKFEKYYQVKWHFRKVKWVFNEALEKNDPRTCGITSTNLEYGRDTHHVVSGWTRILDILQ
ncbi:hypothetical protein S245_037797, partial [Arachis hypogaea]